MPLLVASKGQEKGNVSEEASRKRRRSSFGEGQASGFAQPSSVWIEDLTANEVVAAVSAGRTTLIYCGGALHSDGPAITLGKHIYVAREVAQRVAEQLGNALVLPINPYAPAYQQLTSSSPMFSIVGGTVSLSDEAYGLVTKDVVNSAILAVRKSEGLVGTGFKNVMIMGDHSTGQETLQRVAKDLDLEWKSPPTVGLRSS